jgi:ribonuclease HI
VCKVNVDAALSKTKVAGAVGAVCRDENGTLLGSSARVIEGTKDPATLEAYACAESLSLAADLNIQKIVLATDCLVVVREINGGSKSCYATILLEIEERRRHFEYSSVIHENRSMNIEAHRLARSYVSLEANSCTNKYYQLIKKDLMLKKSVFTE